MDKKVAVYFRSDPPLRPGTAEAQRSGCTCRFESNLAAGFLSAERAERGDGDDVVLVIAKDCPLHEVIGLDPEDASGLDAPRGPGDHG
jgi:hypothetical protein